MLDPKTGEILAMANLPSYNPNNRDWFDPRRTRSDYVPSGFRGPGVRQFAVVGHDFGLDLSAEEKKALIAFLRTL